MGGASSLFINIASGQSTPASENPPGRSFSIAGGIVPESLPLFMLSVVSIASLCGMSSDGMESDAMPGIGSNGKANGTGSTALTESIYRGSCGRDIL